MIKTVRAFPDQAAAAKALSTLPALPKLHRSYPFGVDEIPLFEPGLLTQVAHLLRSLPFWGLNCTAQHLKNLETLCFALVQAGCDHLHLHTKFWNKFGPDPTWSKAHIARVREHQRANALFKKVIAQFNERHGTNIAVTSITLECEELRVTGDGSHNKAVKYCQQVAESTMQRAFPAAIVGWYNFRPGIGLFTENQLRANPLWSVALYVPADLDRLRRGYRDVVERHAVYFPDGRGNVELWAALGGSTPVNEKFDETWDYSWRHSWDLGAEINDQSGYFASQPEHDLWPTPRVMFWPTLLHPRMPQTLVHLYWYCCGVAGIKPPYDEGVCVGCGS